MPTSLSTEQIRGEIFGANISEILEMPGISYEGQKVSLCPQAKSILELAYEMDDCPDDSRLIRGHTNIIERDIKDKKKAEKRQKTLDYYVNRLDPNRATREYTDYERRLHRLKQQVMLQNSKFFEGTSKKGLTFNGESLSEYLLSELSRDFDEVTDQDNLLEYLQAMEDIESEANSEETQASKKMLERLQESGDVKYQSRIEDLLRKIHSFEEQIRYSPLFREALVDAQKKLRKSHEQEIKDGYNLIPKAANLLASPLMIGGKQIAATDLAAIYRDKILSCNNFWEAFLAIVSICRGSSNSSSRSNSSNRSTSVS
ncbi:MAG: hypothetical protein LBI56_02875 [Puniceicoccales bacterium]|jgi:hypothetical protein|nr:hypothetical protein [Puniceicoccales bacterium]